MKHINKKRFSLVGLKKCLEKFDENHYTYAKYGKWSIANGGYDLIWELYYNNLPILDCIYRGEGNSEIEIVNDYSHYNILDVIIKAQSVFTYAKYEN